MKYLCSELTPSRSNPYVVRLPSLSFSTRTKVRLYTKVNFVIELFEPSIVGFESTCTGVLNAQNVSVVSPNFI